MKTTDIQIKRFRSLELHKNNMEIDTCFWLFPTNDRYITHQRDISIKRGNINTIQSFLYLHSLLRFYWNLISKMLKRVQRMERIEQIHGSLYENVNKRHKSKYYIQSVCENWPIRVIINTHKNDKKALKNITLTCI